jgi:hypothetical protein
LTLARAVGIVEAVIQMKVHITLDERVRSDPEAKTEVLQRVCDAGNLSGVNTRRFDRHGIISGDVDPDKIDVVEHIDGVQSVSVDQVQRALAK